MSKKRTTEQNRLKGARYRLRKRVASLEQEVKEQEKKLTAIKESGSPEDIERVERNVVFSKKTAELFSQYKVENILTKEQYSPKRMELKESLFKGDLKQKKSEASRKYYYKARYGSEWQQVMFEEKMARLNIPFKSGTPEYKKMYRERKLIEQQKLEARMVNALGHTKRDTDFIGERIAKKRKFYDNHKSLNIPKELTRYHKYMDSHGYRDFFDLPSEIMSELKFWDRLDICERFALWIIPVYASGIKHLKLVTIPPYNIFDFIPPFMGINDNESMLLKWREKEFLELKVFIDKHLQKEVDKNITVEEPAEK